MRNGCTLRWSVTAEPRESDPLQSAEQIRSLPPTGDCAGLSSIRTAVFVNPDGTSKRVLSGTRLRAILTSHNRR